MIGLNGDYALYLAANCAIWALIGVLLGLAAGGLAAAVLKRKPPAQPGGL